MAESQTGAADDALEDLLVVDTDVHVISQAPPIAEQIAAKLEMPYSHLLDPNEGTGPYRFPTSGAHSVIPEKMSVFGNETVVEPADIDGPLLDELGVDHPILNITPLWDTYPDTTQILQEMPATNDVLTERFLDANDDYFGLISVQTRVPHEAAEEIDRLAGEDQFVGIMVHPGGQWRGFGDPKFDPIWAAAEDHDLAVTFHTSATGLMWQMPGVISAMSTMPELHALSHPWSMMWAVTSLVTEGTPAKFPGIDWVFLESGIAWVPYMMARLNREYSTWRQQAPLLERMPEAYMRDRFYFSTQPLSEFLRPAHMQAIIDILGPEMIMFSSDHPHFDFDNPSSIRAFFDHLPREDVERVFAGNAIEAFDLPL